MTHVMKNLPMTALVVAMAAVAVTGIAHAKGHGPSPVSFAELDTDNDGQVTKTELDAQGAVRFAKVDTDSDGFLSVAEIEAAGQEKAAERAVRMMKHLDADEDGKLSEEEMSNRGKGRGGKDRGAKMIERFDTDENGSLSEEEFAAAQEKMSKRKGKKKKSGE
jgi:Ca2+-binding EF-hand superfamily protein